MAKVDARVKPLALRVRNPTAEFVVDFQVSVAEARAYEFFDGTADTVPLKIDNQFGVRLKDVQRRCSSTPEVGFPSQRQPSIAPGLVHSSTPPRGSKFPKALEGPD
jgi:hypothetical protein